MKDTWKDISPAGTIREAGSAAKYNAGSWKTFKPIWHKDRCIQCLQCWIFCPDSAINVNDKKRDEYNYYHCKGCGICEVVCPAKPKKAITMEMDKK